MLLLIKQVNSNVDALRDDLVQGLSAHRDELKAVVTSAFPEGDADGHRRHHEAVIKAAEERADFWKTMRKELGKYGLVGFTGWAAYALWQSFLQGPHR